MKKMLSVMLVFVLLLSSVTTGAWALDNSAPVGVNLMKDYTYKDWKVTSRATINAPTESFSGDTSNAFSVTKLMWRSAYTKLDLEAGQTYELKFYYKEEAPSKVYLTDSENRGVLMAPTGTMTFGEEITLTNKDYSNNLLNDLNYNVPSDKEGWNIVTAVISPSVTGEHTFCFTGAAPDVNDLSLIHFSDFSLVKQGEDPNVLNDTVMAGLKWNALWNTGLRDPKAADLDKSQSYSGNAYAMTFGRNSRYRDNYTTVTLEPDTKYNFSFRYKSGTTDELIYKIGFVDASKVDFSTIKGDFVKNHLTDASTSLLGENEATIGQELGGVWNLASTTFTTGTAKEYIMYIYVGEVVADQGFTILTLSDFNLVAEEKEQEIPETATSQLLNVANWNSTWRLQGATVNIENSTDSCKGGGAVSVNKSNWRSTFVKLTLTANTKYDLTFNYKGTSAVSNLHLIALTDIDEAKYANNLDHIIQTLKAGAGTVFTQSYSALNYDGNTWNEVSASFTTKNNTEYYLVFENNTSGSGFVASDFSLVAEEGQPEQPEEENALANSKATDWFSSWNGAAGTEVSGAIFVRCAYRSAYTKVTLKPNTKYELSFSHGEVRVTDIRVFAASEITNPATQLMTPDSNGGPAPGGTTNLATDAVTTTCPATPAAGEFYTSSESFTTTNETEYYIFLDCGAFSTTAILLKDLKLVTKQESEEITDPNALNDTVMAGLAWNAIWNTGLRNPKTANLDKSQSYSGNAYAMTFGRNARYRDNYTTVTLKPNTTYNFSFRYKSSSDGQGEVISDIGFVDASKVNFSTYKGDTVASHLTDSATPILGKDNAVKEQLTDGTWNLVTTTFTTGDASEYVMYLNCQTKNGDAGFQVFTLSDFSLVEGEGGSSDTPQSVVDQLINVANWNSTWRLQGATVNIENSTDSCKGGEAVSVNKSNWRSTFVKLNLTAKTKYKLTFNYKGTSAVSNLHLIALNDIDSAKYAAKPDHLITALKDGVGTVLTQGFATLNYDGNTWNEVSASFKTGDNTEYYLVFENNTAGSGFVASDFAVEIDTTPDEDDEEELPDPDNLLADTKPADWTSSWGYKQGVYSGNAISLGVAWRSGYTKVTLKPNVSYKFQFNFENVKVKDIRVYAASEITDMDTQMLSAEGGGAVTGGTNNLAPDAITSTCIAPVLGETYTASEIFTTSSETEYYIIFDATEFVVTSILLKKISLKKYFDPATDIFGTIRNTNGGTVKNKGETPYEKGKETTITATPLEGNAFDGWYDADGKKVSSDASYTFTVKGEFDLTAKFKGPNMPYIDWMAENGMDGTFENGTMLGWHAYDPSSGVVAHFATFTPKDFASHSGKKALVVSARYQMSNFEFTNLTKNSDYYLSFYIYCPDLTPYDSTAEVGKQGFRLNQLSLSVGGDTIWSRSNHFSDGNNGWHRVEFFFNTGNATSATLSIFYAGDTNATEKSVHLDDVMFVQYVADGLDNGDFEAGKEHWMGEYTHSDEGGNKAAGIAKDKKMYQSVAVDAHSSYTVSFKAKGELKAAATQINKYSTKPSDLVSSVTNVTTSGDWNEYTFDVYTGMNSAINLVFEALADGAMVDDIKFVKNEDAAGTVLEKIDFETDRFAIKNSTTNTDVYEVYEGAEFAHSGNKSLHFKYGAADSKTEYVFNESYLGFQISNKRVYRLSFYYKTAKGNALKISPDFLGAQAGKISVTQTAAGDGWYLVEFFASSSSAVYFDPIIANIAGKTKADFYVDDITYTIMSAVVLDSEPTELYAEPPVALLYNEGFEEAITSKNWGKLTSSMKVVKGDTQFGDKFLRVNGKTFYVLPVTVEAGVQYYFSASVRGKGGYIGLSTTADGKTLFNGVSGKLESFVSANSNKWVRDGFKFSAPMSGTIYLVIAQESGSMDIDNVLIYKEQYALEEVPLGHDIIKPYDYKATSGKNYIVNGGYNADGSVAEDGSPSTGDTFPAVTIVLITLAAAVVMLLSGRKNKKEAE